MFRRVVMIVAAACMLASLHCVAQDTSAAPAQNGNTAQTQSSNSTQTPGASSTPAQSSSATTVPPPGQHPKLKKLKRGKKNTNPIANLDSKQPDKVLFDRAQDALKHGKYDVARLSLQTLINTYPDSEYVARAKLAIGDSWYAEGGTAGFTQAESEYKDFITFFPNMPEAAEAQMKIANIHFKEMEKADRDPTHARRAEEEYRQLILNFPDSPLVPEAKQRLLEVQEVLARREYLIGHFYFLRETYPAAIARLRSVSDSYPLFSQADDVLFELGTAYEKEVDLARRLKMNETTKGILIKLYTQRATEAYDRILTRYPLEGRAPEAKKRLEAMKQPIPQATPQAIAEDKREIESRGSLGHVGKVIENFHRGPDVSEATHVGEPTLVDPQQFSAPDLVRGVTEGLNNPGAGGGSHVSVEKTGEGAAPSANAPAPHSDATPGTAPANDAPAATDNATVAPASGAPAGSDMKNDLPPASNGTAPVPPPAQVNEVAGGDQSSTAQPAASSSGQQQTPPASPDESSSKKKKKKHLLLF